ELVAILIALLVVPKEMAVDVYTNSAAMIQAIKKTQMTNKANEVLKTKNTSILKRVKKLQNIKELKLHLHKIKSHSKIEANNIVNKLTKKDIINNKIIKVK
ncbi:44756_t:CDS:1, partial [Gigaspora margarita]